MLKVESKTYKTSKFIRKYGITLQKMSEKYGVSTGYLRILHASDELHAFIEEQEKEKVEIK